MRRFLNVLLPLPMTEPIYTYYIEGGDSVPNDLVGQLVLVSFGRGGKKITGVVWADMGTEVPKADIKYKSISQILAYEPIPTETLRVWQWVADYYMCSLGEVFHAAVPATFRPELKADEEAEVGSYKGHLIEGWVPCVELLRDEERVGVWMEKLKRSPTTKEALQILVELANSEESLPMPLVQWSERLGVSSHVVNRLRTFGVLVQKSVPLTEVTEGRIVSDKAKVEDRISAQVSIKDKETLLLHCVHSNIRERVPYQLLQRMWLEEKRVLLLFPTLDALEMCIPELEQLIDEHGLHPVHSGVSTSQRDKAWVRALSGEVGIYFGLRSAVWLPFTALDLVVVVDEEDTGYRQYEPAPRFTASRVAQILAYVYSARCLLTSSTPSVESFMNAQRGKYTYRKVVFEPSSAELECVDMQSAYEKNKVQTRMLSFEMVRAIDETCLSGGTVLLLYQRKGFAKRITCTACGASPKCLKCHTTLRYYSENRHLVCPMCGYYGAMPSSCTECHGDSLELTGTGIERLATAVRRQFVGAEVVLLEPGQSLPPSDRGRIVLVDSFTPPLPLLQSARAIGVVQLDLLTTRLDFRANEWAYRFLVKCRDESPLLERMVVQYFAPGQNALAAFGEGGYEKMIGHELEERLLVEFPPFSRMLDICFEGRDKAASAKACQAIAKALELALSECSIMDPSPLPSQKKEADIGYKLSLMAPLTLRTDELRRVVRYHVDLFLSHYRGPQLRIYYDVDPE